jgi:hypothetical protein
MIQSQINLFFSYSFSIELHVVSFAWRGARDHARSGRSAVRQHRAATTGTTSQKGLDVQHTRRGSTELREELARRTSQQPRHRGTPQQHPTDSYLEEETTTTTTKKLNCYHSFLYAIIFLCLFFFFDETDF